MFNTIKSNSVNNLSKALKFKTSDKSNTSGKSYSYILRNGRLCRMSSGADTKIFKTDGINSFIAKRKSKIRIGSRPQNYRKAPEPALAFYNSNKPILDSFEVDVNKAVIIDGCFDTNKVTLQRTAIPDVDNKDVLDFPDSFKIRQLRKSIKATIRKIGIEKLFCPTFNESGNCKFNKDTKPGFSCEYILNYKDKGKASRVAYETARVIWNNIEKKANKVRKNQSKHLNFNDRLNELKEEFLNNPVPGKGFYDVGARAKREHIYEENELGTSRAIHMPEFHNEIVMAPWIDNITLHIKNKRNGPIYIGNSISDFVRFERDLKRNNYFAEGDWRRFDSTLYLRICIVAISILRCFYDINDVRADAFFFFIAERICLKDYYLPGGRIVRMIHGLPSGTKCTNLLGSIINLLCLNYCIEPFNSKKFSFAVGGDDFVILSSESITDERINIIKDRSKDLGMEFKFLDRKFKETEFLNDLPYFYKYSVRDGLPYLKPSDMYWRIFVPWNKSYNNSLKYFKFLDEQIPLLGYPNASHLIFYSLYVNMHRRVHRESNMTIKRVYKIHLNLFNKYSDKIFFKSRNIDEYEINSLISSSKSEFDIKDVKILLGWYNKDVSTFFEF